MYTYIGNYETYHRWALTMFLLTLFIVPFALYGTTTMNNSVNLRRSVDTASVLVAFTVDDDYHDKLTGSDTDADTEDFSMIHYSK